MALCLNFHFFLILVAQAQIVKEPLSRIMFTVRLIQWINMHICFQSIFENLNVNHSFRSQWMQTADSHFDHFSESAQTLMFCKEDVCAKYINIKKSPDNRDRNNILNNLSRTRKIKALEERGEQNIVSIFGTHFSWAHQFLFVLY